MFKTPLDWYVLHEVYILCDLWPSLPSSLSVKFQLEEMWKWRWNICTQLIPNWLQQGWAVTSAEELFLTSRGSSMTLSFPLSLTRIPTLSPSCLTLPSLTEDDPSSSLSSALRSLGITAAGPGIATMTLGPGWRVQLSWSKSQVKDQD